MESMLEMEVVRQSMSPYASPIFMVKKKDGSNRVCGDFRKLNKITEVDPKPMTTAEHLFRRLSGMKYLSKIYLTERTLANTCSTRGCVQNCRPTVFMTPDGYYEFLRMPFAKVNTGAILV